MARMRPQQFTVNIEPNTAAREDPAAYGERQYLEARRRNNEWHRRIDAIGTLFGEGFRAVLLESGDLMYEAADESRDGWRRAYQEAVEREADVAHRVDLLREHVSSLCEELARRAKRSGRPVPEIVTAARFAAQLEPF